MELKIKLLDLNYIIENILELNKNILKIHRQQVPIGIKMAKLKKCQVQNQIAFWVRKHSKPLFPHEKNYSSFYSQWI